MAMALRWIFAHVALSSSSIMPLLSICNYLQCMMCMCVGREGGLINFERECGLKWLILSYILVIRRAQCQVKQGCRVSETKALKMNCFIEYQSQRNGSWVESKSMSHAMISAKLPRQRSHFCVTRKESLKICCTVELEHTVEVA